MEDLAMMAANGFEKTATKEELVALEKKMTLDSKEVHDHLDRIEHIFIRAHNNRIEKLEDDMRMVKTMLEKLTHRT